MKFFNLKDYLKSWSVWGLGAITVTPILNDTTGIINAVIPEQYQPVTLSILGAITLVLRAIKQVGLSK